MRFVWLVVFIAVPLAIGYVGSLATMPAIDAWYRTLEKPALTPPDFVFGPVWTLLYVLMGAASYRVFLKWREQKEQVRASLIFYGAHLLVNLAWSLVFFGMQNPEGALWIIALLIVMIVVMMRMFGRVDKLASWLLVPYLAWVSFATYLNISIAYLNY